MDGMAPSLQDFEPGSYRPVTEISNFVGSGGLGSILRYGTSRYIMTSDKRIKQKMCIPNMAHSPIVLHRLLAPQFLQKVERLEQEKNEDIFQSTTRQTGLTINEKYSTLCYRHDIHTETIKHLPGASIPAMYVNAETGLYEAYAMALDTITSDDETTPPLSNKIPDHHITADNDMWNTIDDEHTK